MPRTVYGNDWSENGWRMCNRDECEIPNVPLEFINAAACRKGDVATILGAWMMWYDRNVEPIESTVWGWSNINDVGDSNHLSGTAIDINAPKYPWGRRVMPQYLIDRVRRGLDIFEGSIFWGADWDRADEMHYQIAWEEGDPRVHAFAEKLRRGNDDMSWNDPIKNFNGDVLPAGAMLSWIDKHSARSEALLAAILDNLTEAGTAQRILDDFDAKAEQEAAKKR